MAGAHDGLAVDVPMEHCHAHQSKHKYYTFGVSTREQAERQRCSFTSVGLHVPLQTGESIWIQAHLVVYMLYLPACCTYLTARIIHQGAVSLRLQQHFTRIPVSFAPRHLFSYRCWLWIIGFYSFIYSYVLSFNQKHFQSTCNEMRLTNKVAVTSDDNSRSFIAEFKKGKPCEVEEKDLPTLHAEPQMHGKLTRTENPQVYNH